MIEINETTFSGDIAYLPSGFLPIRKRLADLAKHKHDWGIEVLEEGENYRVKIEDALNIIVPKMYWDQFQQEAMFKIESGKFVVESTLEISPNFIDLSPFLRAETPSEIKRELRRTEEAFRTLLNTKRLYIMENEIRNWKNIFGSLNYFTNEKALFNGYTFGKDMKRFVHEVRKKYEDDLGGLQMFTARLEEGNLNKIKMFEKYNYIVSEKIYSKVHGISMVFEILWDKNFRISENVLTDRGSVLLESSGEIGFCYQNRLILPSRGLFMYEGMKKLRQIVEELSDSEDLLDKKEENKK